jgi:hypothetical protein
MKEWRVRHEIFHRLFKNIDLGDDLSNYNIIFENDPEVIIKRALEYPFSKDKLNLYYPGKSYAVAITFAKLLEKEFNENFYEVLNDDNLLYENDPYFKPYLKDKKVYDSIIKFFPFNLIFEKNIESDNFKKTIEYFYKEFLLHEETKFYAPTK